MSNLRSLAGTVAALAALTVPLSGVGQEAAREAPPEGGEPRNFSLPAKQESSLGNGLEFTAVPFGSVPKATVAVVVRAGNLNEGDKTWLADLTGDFLLEGTHTRGAEDIAREAAAIGGSISVSVGADTTTVSGDVLAEFAPDMIRLLADIVRHPRFPATELERLRRDRLRQVSVAKTQPDQMALAAFRRALYGNHPYGRLFPEEERFAAYDIDHVRAFYEENFGARRTQVYISGMFDDKAALAAVEAAFGDWRQGPEALVRPPEPAEGKVSVDVIDRPGASQSNVYLGLPAIGPEHEDWVRLEVTNTLLGGSFASRITRNLREDKGYTYSPNSTLSTRYRDGYWAQVAAVTTDATGPAIEEIFHEIDRLQTTPPPEDELSGIRNYSAGLFVLRNSTRNGIINVLSYLDLHGLPDSWLTNYVSRVFAVTPAEVSATARQYLRAEDMTLVVVGDRGRIAGQVAPWLGGDEQE